MQSPYTASECVAQTSGQRMSRNSFLYVLPPETGGASSGQRLPILQLFQLAELVVRCWQPWATARTEARNTKLHLPRCISRQPT